MNKIISYWFCKNIYSNNKIINIANKYSKQNNLDLINLNILDKVFNIPHWFLCNKTNKLYFINLVNHNYNNIIPVLSELNYNTYTELLINNDDVLKTDKTINEINKKSSREIRNLRLSLLKSYNKDSSISASSISASSIRNYMLNDPIIDYLKEYNSIKPFNKKRKINKINKINKFNKKQDNFTDYILKAGVEFEEELINILSKEHEIMKVADYTESREVKKFKETINLMKKGVPIIYQGVLHNSDNNTFGLPDLIVRSDYINKLLKYQVISDEESKIKSPLLKTNFHYKIIDIKHSTIHLRSDGLHILNNDNVPAYKGQVYIYTQALNKVLGININKAFIWGKKYSYESCNIKYNITNYLNKLAIINYDNIDSEYIEKTNEGIEWIKSLKNEGSLWSLSPLPSRSELYPNMKNDKDCEFHGIKRELSDEIGEITQVWNCGYKKRKLAHSKGVYSWKDPNFNSKLINMGNTKNGLVIDKILDINRQNKDIIKPDYIKFERDKWHSCNNDMVEFYLDFETLSSNLDSNINSNINDDNRYIFMIGIGYIKNNNWVFNSFIMENKSYESEEKMFNEFMFYINQILFNENKTKCKLYHWSYAEVGSYLNYKFRHNVKINDSHINFYDLNKVFVNEPITIKGALDFSLKTIAKALKENNLIESFWDTESKCSNGLNAMIMANNLYLLKKDNIINDNVMKEIIHYNEIDCKVLWEIHKLMKSY